MILDLLLAALVLLAIYGVGRALRRFVPLGFWGRGSDLAFALAFGLGALTLLLFGFSLLGLLRPWLGWLLIIIGVGLAVLHWRALLEDAAAAANALRSIWQGGWFAKAVLLIMVGFVLTNLLADLAPPVEGDSVHQYLLLPTVWVEEGRYVQPTHIWAATLPGSMMMLSAWGLLLRDSFSLATLITCFGMSLFFALGVYALARRFVPQGAAMLASAAAYTMPDAAYLAQSAKVDMGWALFEALTLAALFRFFDEDDDPRWLVLSGVMLGLAAGSKNQVPLSIALLGLWLVGRMLVQHGIGRALRSGFTFGLAVLATGFPYYLYNAIAHLNPFYPVFASTTAAWWGATPSPRSELGTEIVYEWTVGGYITNLWNASLGHGPEFYLGFIAGPVFLLAVPIGIALGLLRGEKALWRMLAYAMVFSVAWFFVKQAARHFLPGLMLLAVVAGNVLWRLDQQSPVWPRRIVLSMAGLALTWNLISIWGVLYWSGAWRVAAGIESREAYLVRWHDTVITADFPDWGTLEQLNTLGAEARVVSLHATMPLYAAPDLVSGNWGDRIAYQGITDPDELLALFEAHDIGYVLTWTIDEPDAALFASPAFLDEHADLIYDGPRAQLYRLKD
ncbi:MAG: glycosyltransferase family 39 protein [Anaerolineae bacterium]